MLLCQDLWRGNKTVDLGHFGPVTTTASGGSLKFESQIYSITQNITEQNEKLLTIITLLFS